MTNKRYISGLVPSFCLNFLLCMITYSYEVETVKPHHLWDVINSTLLTDKMSKKTCLVVVLYNDDSKSYVETNYEFFANAVLINTDHNAPDKFMTDENVEKIREKGGRGCPKSKTGISEVPCIIVISLVDTSREVERMKQEYPDDLQTYKYELSVQFTKLLQFRSPIKRRHLVLVRWGKDKKDFGQCGSRSNCKPFLKYPKRLVPIWEQVIFDFFPTVRAINVVGKRGEKEVGEYHTRKEEANFIWMCDDLIQGLEGEDSCAANPNNITQDCRDKILNGPISRIELTNCSRYAARH